MNLGDNNSSTGLYLFFKILWQFSYTENYTKDGGEKGDSVILLPINGCEKNVEQVRYDVAIICPFKLSKNYTSLNLKK